MKDVIKNIVKMELVFDSDLIITLFLDDPAKPKV